MWVKGVLVIKGYLNWFDVIVEIIMNGWLYIGDVVCIDEDGFIYIVDWVKDMVLCGGENIYCVEVENVIFEYDVVVEVLVFGLLDDWLGEEVGVVVVLWDGLLISVEEFCVYCLDIIVKYKILCYIWFMDKLLLCNVSGKFLWCELKEIL